MAQAAEKSESFEAIAKKWGEHLEGSWEAQLYGDVAMIPFSGVLMRQMSFWGLMSGSSAYEILLKEIVGALENPQVKAVILDVDSPATRSLAARNSASTFKTYAAASRSSPMQPARPLRLPTGSRHPATSSWCRPLRWPARSAL
jgi:ClpP class serine protease